MTKNTAVDWLITQIRNQAQNGTLDALVITELRKEALTYINETYGGDK